MRVRWGKDSYNEVVKFRNFVHYCSCVSGLQHNIYFEIFLSDYVFKRVLKITLVVTVARGTLMIPGESI